MRHHAWSVALLVLTLQAHAQSPLGLSYVQTPEVQLIYPRPALAYLVPHALGTFSQALRANRRIFGWTPSERIGLVLNDFSDYGNASATPLPRNTLRVDVEPTSNAFETNPGSERMYSTMNHEMVHIATTDVANSQDRFWRGVFFGKVPASSQHPESLLYSWLTVPRFTVPRWYLEGSAVFMETWMDGGLGRAQGGYDEMVFRAMVRDNAHFFSPLGLASRGTRIDFQVGANAYLYGTRFFTWLAYAHGPEKVVAWLRRDEGSARDYADQFRQVFGLALDEGWQRWITFEREFQQRNLEQVRQQPITPQQNLVAKPLGSVSRAHYDEASGVLLGAMRYPGVVEHIGALDTRSGELKRLADIKGAALYSVTSFAFDAASRTAFYTTDNLSWRDVMALDIDSGEQRLLLKDERIGELVFNRADRSLMGVRHQAGLATLVRMEHPYTQWKQVHTFAYGVAPTDLDISADGSLLSASVSDTSGEQVLRVWKLGAVLAGDMKPLSEFRFGQAAPEGFVFSHDARYLYGSAYYTGVSNIYRYEVATGEFQAVSNAESGFFRPVPLADGRLVVFSYSGDGFLPALIDPQPLKDLSAIRFLGSEVAAQHKLVTTWQVPMTSAAAGEAESQITSQGEFHPLSSLDLHNAYPVLQGYKDSTGLGYRAAFGDPLGYASLSVMAAYTPDQHLAQDERAHLVLRGHYLSWRASLGWNPSDFYDLFGPTKRSRKGLAVKLGYSQSLVYDAPRTLDLLYDLAYYDKIATLPEAQNIGAASTRQLSGELALRYSHVRRSLGAVDDEKGITSAAVLSSTRAGGATVAQLRANLDLGLALPLAHASVWSRTALGTTDGARNNPLASFYFGGFGNNRVDEGAVKRYRDYYAMPGFGLNSIGARSFVKQMVEVNLPPLVFESLGQPGLHLQSLRPALFATGLWTEPSLGGPRQRTSNLGGQVDLRLSLLHWYEATLSFGVASGWQGARRAGTEWMVSLKLL